jgi:hypothetical protein
LTAYDKGPHEQFRLIARRPLISNRQIRHEGLINHHLGNVRHMLPRQVGVLTLANVQIDQERQECLNGYLTTSMRGTPDFSVTMSSVFQVKLYRARRRVTRR